jgi:hypothetical protein
LNPNCTAQRAQQRATAGVESTKTPSKSKRIPRVCTSTGLDKEVCSSEIRHKVSHASVDCPQPNSRWVRVIRQKETLALTASECLKRIELSTEVV